MFGQKKNSDAKSSSRLRLGIDVGGTNTDAVLMQGDEVVETVKRPTTEDVGGGVVDAVSHLLENAKTQAQDVTRVMIGTTQFVNAFIQRANLAKTASIRICAPKTDGVPPMVCWPEDVNDIIGKHYYLVEGGAFYTGESYAELDEQQLEFIADDLIAKNIEAVAISSVFSPIRPDVEQRAAEIIKRKIPNILVTKSADIGGVGLIDRENAAIVNASLTPFAHRIVQSMNDAFKTVGFGAQPLFTQNDGTLITGSKVKESPIFTCAAGPTNSIRGAGFLTKSQEAVVIDIGGTTTDIGFLNKGFPRETSAANYIGGIRTNFRMPDILSIALGGGTKISQDGDNIFIGPESVGYRLPSEALVFGGNTLTATDIAIAAGNIELGDVAALSALEPTIVSGAMNGMREKLEVAIEQMRTSAKLTDVILVGGGSILIKDNLNGVARLLRPDHAGVANAVGAAIAQVSGRTDKLYDFADGRDAAIEQAKSDAIAQAVQAGAQPETIEIMDIEELPMTHMQSTSVRVRINAVGELA